eukprot:5138612-Amphidinium_carterae.5
MADGLKGFTDVQREAYRAMPLGHGCFVDERKLESHSVTRHATQSSMMRLNVVLKPALVLLGTNARPKPGHQGSEANGSARPVVILRSKCYDVGPLPR